MPRPVVDAPTGTILLIDANLNRYACLQSRLQDLGHQVHSFGLGINTLAWLKQYHPDLLLLSTDLPDINSFELCRQIKAVHPLRRVPVLFTGEGDRLQDRLDAFAAGGVDFIPQPCWPEEMVARIHSHLATASWQHRIQRKTQQVLSGQSTPLLASLQRTLHKQAQKLKAQNQQLQAEVQEREQVEQALRQEQHKSEKLLLNILPQAIADQLKQFQGSLAERFDDATVMFADIVNFTPMAAEMSPLQLVDLLNKIFSTFDHLAEKYQLEKIKTIGDAYMVVGGLPTPQIDHAYAVVEMAREMQQVIRTFKRQDGQPLQLRIGINTGDVVAGVIGIRKFSYDLWGDTVNVASRMESQGVPGKIQVTGSTYNRLKDRYTFQPWGEVLVKGKGYLPIYHLLEPKPLP
jgi:class 3 adenylate cyclase/FixJ family two-component response regulator